MAEKKLSYNELEEKLLQLENEINNLKINKLVFFENSFDGIVIVNPETAGFIDFNDQACNQLGYTREEFEKLTIYDIEAIESRKETQNHIKQIIESRKSNFETKQRNKSGQLRDMAVSARMINFRNKEMFLCICRDITELKQFERELIAAKEEAEKNELLFKSLFNNLNNSSSLYEVIYDENRNPVDYKFLAINPRYENTIGIKSADLIGKTLLTVFPGTEKIWLDTFREVVLTGNHATIENYSVETNKFFELTIFIPQKGRMALIGTDVTARKMNELEIIKAKNKAEESNAFIQAIIENSNNSIWAIDSNYKITYFNKVFKDEYLNAFNIELKIGMNVIEILPEHLKPIWIERYTRVLKNESLLLEDNVEISQNNFVYITVSMSPILSNGKVIGASIYGANITERKLTEEKNRRNDERMHLALKATNDVVWDWDIINDTQTWNEAGIKVFGWEEIVSKPQTANWWVQRVHPDDVVRVEESFFTVVNNPELINWQDEYRFRKADGSYAQVYDRGFVIRDQNGKAIRMIGAMLDITERKNAELEILKAKEHAEESEALYRKMNENSPLGMHFYKLDEHNRLIFVGANPAADAFLNVDNSQFIGKTIEEAFPPLEHTEIPDRYRNAAKNGIPWFTEQIIYDDRKIAGAFEVRAFQTAPNNMVAIFNEITKRKQAEQELIRAKEEAEESEEKHRFLFENTIQGVIYMNPSNEIIYANKASEKILGLTIEQMEGRNSTDSRWRAIHEDGTEFPGNEHPSAITLKTGKPVNNIIMGVFNPIIHDYKWININSIPKFRNGEDKPYCAVTTFEDITEIRKKNIELKKAKEHAEESDRLKTAFLQNLSHEIRTPLNAICGFSEFLNENNISEEKRKSFTTIIRTSSNQLLSIVSDILTISSLETNQEKININKVSINNILIDLLSIYKPQAVNQNISLFIKQQLNDTQSEIYTDGTKITQILTNLLTNALKFTHQGSIEFGYRLIENKLEFFVKDTGIGINPDYCDKIFERFRQADTSINKKYGGTGLGLSISKGFVELLGGKIWVKSEPDKGSTFYFTIPYCPVNDSEKTFEQIKQNKNYKSVLVAEDEEFNYLYIEEILINLNLTIIHTKDGQETVDVCMHNPNIDLILMDIKMPVMDGFEAAKIIKKLKPDLPIIAQSAYALEHEKAKYEGVFDDYLTKPITSAKLKASIYKYIQIQNLE